MRITAFDVYRDMLKEKSGLVLTPDKSYLLDSRLSPVAKKWGFANIDAMTISIQGVPDPKLINDIIEAMTTNETSFFRDSKPFDIFRDHVLPYLIQKRAAKKSLRIWCAAASSGQEPYSLSMIMKEKAALAGWKIELLATDISNDILELAKAGVYSQFEVQRGLPITLLMKYFTQLDGNKWKLNEDIRKMARFENFNLLDSMARLGAFDVIFCRNVLIYFDEKTKKSAMERMASQMEKDGFLFLGGAETVIGLTEAFKPVPEKRGLYVGKDSPHLNVPAMPAAAPAVAKPGTPASAALASGKV